jgi:hypothetical protein
MLSVVILSVVFFFFVMLSVNFAAKCYLCRVSMPSVIMLNVAMSSVVAPKWCQCH